MGTDKRARQKANTALARQARVEAARQEQRRSRLLLVIIVGVVVAVLAVAAVFIRRDTTVETADAGTTSTVPTTPTTVPGTFDPKSVPPIKDFTLGSTNCPTPPGTPKPVLDFADAPRQCIDPRRTYNALFDTSEGTIKVKLDTTRTPGTANNFVFLTLNRYYDGTRIFRTDPSIDIVQGGSPHTNNAEDPGPGYTIPDEGGTFDFSAGPNGKGPFTYEPGQLVMARSQGPNAAGAQFFFTTGPNAKNLDQYGTYVVFGTVTDGIDVLKNIMALHKDGPNGGAPGTAVTINNVTIEQV